MQNKINWSTIYYNEELDTDGTLIEVHWTQEAHYGKGVLIRDCFQQGHDGEIKINLVFIPTVF